MVYAFQNTSIKLVCHIIIKPKALALMGTASFCGGVRHKRYSVQQETAPDSKT